MGLFDKYKAYKESRAEKRLEKAGKLIKNPKAIKEDRWAALKFLSEDADDANKVVSQLLPRFEYSLEHGILDSREKDLALKGVIRFGESSVPVIEEWIHKTDRIAWPIKALKEVASEEQLVGVLKGALEFEDVRFDQAKVDKNYDILCYLRDYQLEGFSDKIGHFLKDVDERVRFAAAEALIEQESDDVSSLLEPLLEDGSVENRRIKEAIAKAFVSRSWVLKDPSKFEGGIVSDTHKVNSKGMLEQR